MRSSEALRWQTRCASRGAMSSRAGPRRARHAESTFGGMLSRGIFRRRRGRRKRMSLGRPLRARRECVAFE